MRLKIQKLDPRATTPTRATPDSVGLDLHAFLISENGREQKVMVAPGQRKFFATKLAVQPEMGYALFVCSRSGLARNNGVIVLNAPGVIDPDYRGEIGAVLYNSGNDAVYIEHGMRIAQLVALACPVMYPEEVQVLDATLRGSAGFGSSGT